MSTAGACISDGAYVVAAQKQANAILRDAIAEAAINAALALWQRNSSNSVANLQDEIAKRQVKLAEEVHAHAEKFWDAEKAFVDDAFGEGKHTPEYDGMMQGWRNFAESSADSARSMWIEKAGLRCLVLTTCDDNRFKRMAALNSADITSYAARQAEIRSDALNDRRFATQLAALAMGRNLTSNIPAYESLAGSAAVTAAGALTGIINSAAGMLGFAYKYEPARHFNLPQSWDTPSHTAPPFAAPKVETAAAYHYDKPAHLQGETLADWRDRTALK